MARTRIAPTPSGYLHQGNCVNFLLTHWLAVALNGQLQLRIDDIDADRYRREYVDDAFRVLEWLDIDWQSGPRSTDDFEENFSLRARTDYYLDELSTAQHQGLETYACACSRADLRAAGSRTCVANCSKRGVEWRRGETALRARLAPDYCVLVGEAEVPLSKELGDFVLVRRDGLPSYQVASLVEDRDAGTTHIVRGEDLLASTAAQLHLAPFFSAPQFSEVTFLHHALVTDQEGQKLSKSQLAAGPLLADGEQLNQITADAIEIGTSLGIAPPS